MAPMLQGEGVGGLPGAGLFGLIVNADSSFTVLNSETTFVLCFFFSLLRGKFLPGVDFWHITGVVRAKYCYHGNLGT